MTILETCVSWAIYGLFILAAWHLIWELILSPSLKERRLKKIRSGEITRPSYEELAALDAFFKEANE
jgi:hypothetical protein